MTKKHKILSSKEYVKNQGVICPVCRFGDIVADTLNLSSDDACVLANVTCRNCKAQWVDTYKLTGYSELELSEEKT